MSAARIISPETGLAIGSVCACTREDRPDLFDLCKLCTPAATLADIVGDLNDGLTDSWSLFKDTCGVIRVAMLPYKTGVVHMLVNPAEAESDEVLYGFLQLARTVRARLIAFGVTDFWIAHYGNLNSFAKLLEKHGFVGSPVMIVRSVQFNTDGELTRRN